MTEASSHADSFSHADSLYLDGQWSESGSGGRIEVIDPSTEEIL